MPLPIGAIIGGAGALGGLFGGDQQPEMTDEQRRLYHLLLQVFQASHRFANSPVLSTDQERQGLAQSQGLSSLAQSRNREGLFGQLGASDLQNNNIMARQLSNLSAAETAQSSNIYGNAMLQGLDARRQARFGWGPQLLGQAASIAGNPAQPATSGGFDSLLPLIQQAAAQYGSRPRGYSGGGGTTFSNTPGGTGFEPAQSDPTQDPSNTWWP